MGGEIKIKNAGCMDLLGVLSLICMLFASTTDWVEHEDLTRAFACAPDVVSQHECLVILFSIGPPQFNYMYSALQTLRRNVLATSCRRMHPAMNLQNPSHPKAQRSSKL